MIFNKFQKASEKESEITGRTHRADPVRHQMGENPHRQRGKPVAAAGSSDWLDETRKTSWNATREEGLSFL